MPVHALGIGVGFLLAAAISASVVHPAALQVRRNIAPVCVSVCMSFCASVYMFVFVCVSVCDVCLPVCLSLRLCLCLCLCVCASICLSVCPPVCMRVCLSAFRLCGLCVCVTTRLHTSLLVSICLSHLYVCVSMPMTSCLSVHLDSLPIAFTVVRGGRSSTINNNGSTIANHNPPPQMTTGDHRCLGGANVSLHAASQAHPAHEELRGCDGNRCSGCSRRASCGRWGHRHPDPDLAHVFRHR